MIISLLFLITAFPLALTNSSTKHLVLPPPALPNTPEQKVLFCAQTGGQHCRFLPVGLVADKQGSSSHGSPFLIQVQPAQELLCEAAPSCCPWLGGHRGTGAATMRAKQGAPGTPWCAGAPCPSPGFYIPSCRLQRGVSRSLLPVLLLQGSEPVRMSPCILQEIRRWL